MADKSIAELFDQPLYYDDPDHPDDIILEGSDSELSERSLKRKRADIEFAAKRYLKGHAPYLISAQLKGADIEGADWGGPIRKKRKIRDVQVKTKEPQRANAQPIKSSRTRRSSRTTRGNSPDELTLTDPDITVDVPTLDEVIVKKPFKNAAKIENQSRVPAGGRILFEPSFRPNTVRHRDYKPSSHSEPSSPTKSKDPSTWLKRVPTKTLAWDAPASSTTPTPATIAPSQKKRREPTVRNRPPIFDAESAPRSGSNGHRLQDPQRSQTNPRYAPDTSVYHGDAQRISPPYWQNSLPDTTASFSERQPAMLNSSRRSFPAKQPDPFSSARSFPARQPDAFDLGRSYQAGQRDFFDSAKSFPRGQTDMFDSTMSFTERLPSNPRSKADLTRLSDVDELDPDDIYGSSPPRRSQRPATYDRRQNIPSYVGTPASAKVESISKYQLGLPSDFDNSHRTGGGFDFSFAKGRSSQNLRSSIAAGGFNISFNAGDSSLNAGNSSQNIMQSIESPDRPEPAQSNARPNGSGLVKDTLHNTERPLSESKPVSQLNKRKLRRSMDFEDDDSPGFLGPRQKRHKEKSQLSRTQRPETQLPELQHANAQSIVKSTRVVKPVVDPPRVVEPPNVVAPPRVIEPLFEPPSIVVHPGVTMSPKVVLSPQGNDPEKVVEESTSVPEPAITALSNPHRSSPRFGFSAIIVEKISPEKPPSPSQPMQTAKSPTPKMVDEIAAEDQEVLQESATPVITEPVIDEIAAEDQEALQESATPVITEPVIDEIAAEDQEVLQESATPVITEPLVDDHTAAESHTPVDIARSLPKHKASANKTQSVVGSPAVTVGMVEVEKSPTPITIDKTHVEDQEVSEKSKSFATTEPVDDDVRIEIEKPASPEITEEAPIENQEVTEETEDLGLAQRIVDDQHIGPEETKSPKITDKNTVEYQEITEETEDLEIVPPVVDGRTVESNAPGQKIQPGPDHQTPAKVLENPLNNHTPAESVQSSINDDTTFDDPTVDDHALVDQHSSEPTSPSVVNRSSPATIGQTVVSSPAQAIQPVPENQSPFQNSQPVVNHQSPVRNSQPNFNHQSPFQNSQPIAEHNSANNDAESTWSFNDTTFSDPSHIIASTQTKTPKRPTTALDDVSISSRSQRYATTPSAMGKSPEQSTIPAEDSPISSHSRIGATTPSTTAKTPMRPTIAVEDVVISSDDEEEDIPSHRPVISALRHSFLSPERKGRKSKKRLRKTIGNPPSRSAATTSSPQTPERPRVKVDAPLRSSTTTSIQAINEETMTPEEETILAKSTPAAPQSPWNIEDAIGLPSDYPLPTMKSFMTPSPVQRRKSPAKNLEDLPQTQDSVQSALRNPWMSKSTNKITASKKRVSFAPGNEDESMMPLTTEKSQKRQRFMSPPPASSDDTMGIDGSEDKLMKRLRAANLTTPLKPTKRSYRPSLVSFEAEDDDDDDVDDDMGVASSFEITPDGDITPMKAKTTPNSRKKSFLSGMTDLESQEAPQDMDAGVVDEVLDNLGDYLNVNPWG